MRCAEKPGPKLSSKPFSPFLGLASITRSKTYKTVALDMLPYSLRTSLVSSIFLPKEENKSCVWRHKNDTCRRQLFLVLRHLRVTKAVHRQHHRQKLRH